MGFDWVYIILNNWGFNGIESTRWEIASGSLWSFNGALENGHIIDDKKHKNMTIK